jgi:hypothetical protein
VWLPADRPDTESILLHWDLRPCFICDVRGLCNHREVAVAQETEAEDQRLL